MKTEPSLKNASAKVLFTIPPTFVVVRHAPKPDDPKWVEVMCEGADTDQSICAYLSPFDAMLDSVFNSRPGKSYYAVSASDFVPTVFIDDLFGTLRLGIHLGWPARDGKLIARPNGKPMTFEKTLQWNVNLEHSRSIEVSIEQRIVDCIARLHESAGLPAYRNVIDDFKAWPRARKDAVVARALLQLGKLQSSGTDFNQVALYDPEKEHPCAPDRCGWAD
ncbi:hypothetical protein [Paraburkholderia tagetis]|uniref:Uncharacterized protein n=1 Tax=Paraburkholderia tagetis TaxID=2913261 RepID=A0A9X1RMZ5_9BURK|nr:hypothetical protein [Paraburkholderia tagetis]MCG5074085.1 hypothetical protein [Paraburkholderia tagetis]